MLRRILLVLAVLLLLVQAAQLGRALGPLRAEAFAVSALLWGALAFKGLLLLFNALAVLLLWRLSGFRWRRRLRG